MRTFLPSTGKKRRPPLFIHCFPCTQAKVNGETPPLCWAHPLPSIPLGDVGVRPTGSQLKRMAAEETDSAPGSELGPCTPGARRSACPRGPGRRTPPQAASNVCTAAPPHPDVRGARNPQVKTAWMQPLPARRWTATLDQSNGAPEK